MYKFLILLLAFDAIYCCIQYGQKCSSNDQCCSKKCKTNVGGVYPHTVQYGPFCVGQPINHNYLDNSFGCLKIDQDCKLDGDCCSKVCSRSKPDDTVGYCASKDKIDISFSIFSEAFTWNGYPKPSKDQHKAFLKWTNSNAGIYDKKELALFLAEVLYFSNGLKVKKDPKCAQTNCTDEYHTGKETPGKNYYGRGYLNMTWLSNYTACSEALYNDDRLVKNPELVSDTEEGAFGSAFWYWKRNVHDDPAVIKEKIDRLKCNLASKKTIAETRKRFYLYLNVVRAFRIVAKELGTYGCPETDI